MFEINLMNDSIEKQKKLKMANKIKNYSNVTKFTDFFS